MLSQNLAQPIDDDDETAMMLEKHFKPTDDDLESLKKSASGSNKPFFWRIFSVRFKITLLIAIIMPIEMGYSLEVAFITPFFMRLDTPDALDSIIWLIPPLIVVSMRPFLQRYLHERHRGYSRRRTFLACLAFLASTSMYVLANSEHYARYLMPHGTRLGRKEEAMVFGLISFMILDMSLELLEEIIFEIINDSIDPSMENTVQLWLYRMEYTGKLVGFGVASLTAFGLNKQFEPAGDNMRLAYLVGAVIMVFMFLLISILNYTMDVCLDAGTLKEPAGSRYSFSRSFSIPGEDTDEIASSVDESIAPVRTEDEGKSGLTFDSFLPGISEIGSAPSKVKLLVLTHFFAFSTYLQLAVYGTAWVGITLLKGVPDAVEYSNKRKICDIGVSWGAFTFIFWTMASMITSLILPKLRFTFSDRTVFIFTQLMAAGALISTLWVKSFYWEFFVIPMCGPAYATLGTVLESISVRYEKEQEVRGGTFSKMFSISVFFSQIVMFCVIPVIFLFFPNIDDNVWALFIGGCCAALASVFSFFLQLAEKAN